MRPGSWDNLADDFSEKVLEIIEVDQEQSVRKAISRLGGRSKCAADFGCGVGSSTRLLASYFRSVVGYDFSRPLLRVAKKRTDAANVKYLHLDLSIPTKIRDRFDFSACVNALISHERSTREIAATNIVSMTKHRGYVLFVVPSFESMLRTYQILNECRIADGISPKNADKKIDQDANREIESVSSGIVDVGGVPTKHFLGDELLEFLAARGLHQLTLSRISFPWNMIIDDLPEDFSAISPWDWMVIGQKR